MSDRDTINRARIAAEAAARDALVAARYTAGATLAEIAAELGVTPARVHQRLVRAGVAMRRPGRRTRS